MQRPGDWAPLEREGPEMVLCDGVALRAAFDEGRAVVVRAASAEAVTAALARPEVASVLVPADKRELAELDLVELTYGS